MTVNAEQIGRLRAWARRCRGEAKGAYIQSERELRLQEAALLEEAANVIERTRMAEVTLQPLAITRLRQWAAEHKDPAVMGNVAALCDALEDCSLSMQQAQAAIADLQRLAQALSLEIARIAP